MYVYVAHMSHTINPELLFPTIGFLGLIIPIWTSSRIIINQPMQLWSNSVLPKMMPLHIQGSCPRGTSLSANKPHRCIHDEVRQLATQNLATRHTISHIIYFWLRSGAHRTKLFGTRKMKYSWKVAIKKWVSYSVFESLMILDDIHDARVTRGGDT